MKMLQQLSEKFADLSKREKWLITLCGTVGIFFVVLTLLIDPVMNTLSAKERQLQSTKLSSQQLQGQILTITAQLRKDPNKELNLEYDRLMDESMALSEELASKVDGLVTPDKMAELLEQVLISGNKLQLQSLASLPAEPIQSSEASAISGYYVHPVKIALKGKYFDVVEYLTALESLPVKYYWRSFHYSVEEYPQAQLEFEVYTIGGRKEFIGG
ncbi:type II secretion system protein GspM [Vibrio maerlii]|uniref:type II secretion system protein GspM n=1 Tax=Vibrio maerlii TaxID=2231648 RepID=UPI000E3E357D|nr:type II secretion system protein GspM [Vibrio maerlii]